MTTPSSSHVSYLCNCISGTLHSHSVTNRVALSRGIHPSYPNLWLDASSHSDALTEGLYATDITDAIEGALWGALIGDALGAPMHWFYSWPELRSARTEHFNGKLTGHVATPANLIHPNSASYFSRCNPHNEPVDIWGGAGVGAWAKKGTPYHGTLSAGDNTLTGRLLGALIERCATDARFDASEWLRTYTEALTKRSGPGAHNDTWTDETHRVFFRNVAGAGVAPEEAGMEDSCLSSLVLALPIALMYAHNSDAAAIAIRTAAQFTHKSETASSQATIWGDLITTLIAPYVANKNKATTNHEDVGGLGLVRNALTAACTTLSEGRTDLNEILKSEVNEDVAFHGAPDTPAVFSSR
jgi:ADP-ribosylglycohydrolase